MRDNCISFSIVPEIGRLKLQRDQGYKLDILLEKQYEQLRRYIQYNYITKKHNPNSSEEQQEKRKIWMQLIFIRSNVGFRTNNLLGKKMMEITDNRS